MKAQIQQTASAFLLSGGMDEWFNSDNTENENYRLHEKLVDLYEESEENQKLIRTLIPDFFF